MPRQFLAKNRPVISENSFVGKHLAFTLKLALKTDPTFLEFWPIELHILKIRSYCFTT